MLTLNEKARREELRKIIQNTHEEIAKLEDKIMELDEQFLKPNLEEIQQLDEMDRLTGEETSEPKYSDEDINNMVDTLKERKEEILD